MLDWLIESVYRYGLEQIFRRYYGTYPGIVEDIEDPDGRGRVRVRVLCLGQSSAPTNVWAKPAVFGGTKGHGIFWAPDVGDQVWVGFESGDASRPILFGGWMAKPDVPDEFNSPLLRGVKTEKGHWVRFSDVEGDLHIELHSANGCSASFLDDGSVEIKDSVGSFVKLAAGGTYISDSSGAEIELENSGVLVKDGSGGTIDLSSGQMTIKTTANVTVETAGSCNVDALTVTLGKGASEALVKGNTFVGLFNSHTHASALGPTSPPIPPMIPGVHTSLTVKTS